MARAIRNFALIKILVIDLHCNMICKFVSGRAVQSLAVTVAALSPGQFATYFILAWTTVRHYCVKPRKHQNGNSPVFAWVFVPVSGSDSCDALSCPRSNSWNATGLQVRWTHPLSGGEIPLAFGQYTVLPRTDWSWPVAGHGVDGGTSILFPYVEVVWKWSECGLWTDCLKVFQSTLLPW